MQNIIKKVKGKYADAGILYNIHAYIHEYIMCLCYILLLHNLVDTNNATNINKMLKDASQKAMSIIIAHIIYPITLIIYCIQQIGIGFFGIALIIWCFKGRKPSRKLSEFDDNSLSIDNDVSDDTNAESKSDDAIIPTDTNNAQNEEMRLNIKINDNQSNIMSDRRSGYLIYNYLDRFHQDNINSKIYKILIAMSPICQCIILIISEKYINVVESIDATKSWFYGYITFVLVETWCLLIETFQDWNEAEAYTLWFYGIKAKKLPEHIQPSIMIIAPLLPAIFVYFVASYIEKESVFAVCNHTSNIQDNSICDYYIENNICCIKNYKTINITEAVSVLGGGITFIYFILRYIIIAILAVIGKINDATQIGLIDVIKHDN